MYERVLITRRDWIKAGIITSVLFLQKPATTLAQTEQLSRLPSLESVDKHILDNASKNQIVMFGESHKKQDDEKYFITLLPKLKNLGFQYLGLEMEEALTPFLQEYIDGKNTFAELDDFLDQYSRIRPSSSYTTLHNLKSLFVEAKKLKLKVIAFDDTKRRDNPSDLSYAGTYREQKMLENLKKHVFNKNPKAKMIIYVGAAHATKYPFFHPVTRKVELMLGHYLNEFTNGHMYSVNLTSYDWKLDYMPFEALVGKS